MSALWLLKKVGASEIKLAPMWTVKVVQKRCTRGFCGVT